METSLYLPVKGFLEQAGYVVKGEVGGCDLVGLSDSDPAVVVICELKLSFNLELILQAVDRAAVADEVWIAARVSAKGKGREADKRYREAQKAVRQAERMLRDARKTARAVAREARERLHRQS